VRAPLSTLLQFLGVKPSPQARDDKGIDEEIRLYLTLPTASDRRILVGRLRKEKDEYVFAYSDDFKARPGLPSLPDFPNRNKTYRSPDLWPFFLVRLPPKDRHDVQEYLREAGIPPENTLEVLGALSRRAISSPYELELAEVS
jgi:HipA-like protein